jgi:nucleoside phosphorylase
MRRAVTIVAALLTLLSYGVASAVAPSHPSAARAAAGPADSAPAGCQDRLLVLSAFPTELGPLLDRTSPRGGNPVSVGGHTFYLGDLEGHSVALTLTGIGPVNARQTTHLALSHFHCGGRSTITGIVFSGVAGGDYIGDVNAATRWTEDGKHFIPVSQAMLRVARDLQRDHKVQLSRSAHLPDLPCLPVLPGDLAPAVTLTHVPTFKVGGTGLTTDPFGGKAFPCIPGATDIFSCRPCDSANVTPKNPVALLESLAPFISPSFFTGYFASSSSPPGKYVSEDNETAEVAKAARAAGVPFIGFRGVSDGGGDPLHLPGYPFSFFVYQQISADNVGAVASAFIRAWHDASSLDADD